MNEKYVTDIKHSRKLVAAGWKRETKFWWRVPFTEDERDITLTTKEDHVECECECGIFFPAPLTDELLEELPDFIPTPFSKYKKLNKAFPGGSYAGWWRKAITENESLPNTLSDLYCWWKGEKRL